MAEKTIITILCCVCGKSLGKKDGQGVSGISHGYCKKCAKAELQKHIASKGEAA